MKGFTIFAALLAVALGSEIDIPPTNVATVSGANANLTCEASGDFSTNRLYWKEHIEDPTGILIFNSAMQGPNDEEEYAIYGKYNLMVKEANLEDGGMYSCGLDMMPQPHKVSLTVFDRPSLLIPALTVGGQYQLECRVRYGSPPPAILNPSQIPQVRVKIDTDEIQGKETRTTGLLGEPSTIEYVVNVTITKDHHLQTFSCEVMLEDPEFKFGDRKILNINHEVWGIEIVPDRKSFFVGETITCGATGYPEPDYKWTAISSPGARAVSTPNLEITSSMVGKNKWKCEASNMVPGQDIKVVPMEVEFDVLPATTAPPSSAVAVQTSGLVMFLCSLIYKLL